MLKLLEAAVEIVILPKAFAGSPTDGVTQFGKPIAADIPKSPLACASEGVIVAKSATERMRKSNLEKRIRTSLRSGKKNKICIFFLSFS